MGEGALGPAEVGKEIAEHRRHAADGGRDRLVSIVEAVMLAVVAVLAAWSGYASAQWSTDSRLQLAQASTARTEANRAYQEASDLKSFDATTFNTWFAAFVADDANGMRLAEKRFRPEFEVAFQAWIATDPANNPDAPPGPLFMPEYQQPKLDEAKALDAKADDLYAEGAHSGGIADDYVRITVYLATVLFLVGISGHFRFTGARVGLIVVGGLILTYAVVLLVQAPRP